MRRSKRCCVTAGVRVEPAQASRVSGMGRASVAKTCAGSEGRLAGDEGVESLSREDLEHRLYPVAASATARHERPRWAGRRSRGARGKV